MSRIKRTDDPPLVPNPQPVVAPEKEQNIRMRPGSPFAVIGVFVECLRARFTGPYAPDGYVWNSDIKKTNIAIESAFNEDKDYTQHRPAIFVDRDEMNTGRVVIGDNAGQNIASGLKAFFALQTCPVLIECVAAKKGESAVLGDLVAVFLQASSDLIQAKFAFHEMTPVVLGRTQPRTGDKQAWVTSVSFNVQYPLRWTNMPTVVLLQEIEARVSASGAESATDYFETLVLSSQSRGE